MKNLSKVLALALLLAPAAARADQWCHGDDEHIWTFFTGQAPYTYMCDDVDTPTVTQAAEYADTQCEDRWDAFASNYSDDGPRFQIYHVEIGNTNICRWKYRCKACVIGFLPHIFLEPVAQLGPAAAGNVANELVKGMVRAIKLHADGRVPPFYLVDVLTDTKEVQVEVDATTGRAQIVADDETAGCLP
ncbi:MAG TPA: hypothetical protein DD490_32760 [Acidobacteria bacterium]|nr:hypothetical protein [Acidobacteriota bacterium]